MTVAALGTLVLRHPLADVAGKAAAPIGAAFTFLPRHRFAVGQADVGHVLGLGRAADLDVGAFAALFRLHRAVWDGGGAGPGRPRRRHSCTGRRGQPADHQVLGRLVEYIASAGIGVPDGRADHRSCILMPLLIMAIAFTLLFVTLHLAAMRNEILRRRVRTMRLMQAQELAQVT